MKRDALLTQLHATAATLKAAYAQVQAQIASISEEEEDADETEDPRCPRCGRSDLVRAGRTDDGRAIHVCVCGANVAAGKVIGG